MLIRRLLVLSALLGPWAAMTDVGAAAPISIVVIGDSNIEGKGVSRSDAYPAQLERALRARGLDASVVNAGKNGDTTFGVLARLDRDVPDGTTLAIVSVGVNDVVVRHQDLAATQGRVQRIAERLRERGIKTLVFPTGKKFQGAIADDPNFHVEGRPGLAGPPPGTTEWHLTPNGYAQVVKNTLPQILAALKAR